MKEFRRNIWKDEEYDYPAAYGFIPNIHAYLHDDDEKRDCMIVLPGGGYCMVVPPEGIIPAMEFYNRGMNVFVLTYTTDITFSIPLKRQPLKDAARAVRFIFADFLQERMSAEVWRFTMVMSKIPTKNIKIFPQDLMELSFHTR